MLKPWWNLSPGDGAAGPQGRLSRGQALSPAAVIGPMPVSGMERGVFSSENQDTGLLLWSND